MRLPGKKALLIGSATGIGKATALLFAREGAEIVVADINQNAGRETAAEINAQGDSSLFIQVDVRNESEIRELVQKAVSHLGGLDILVNLAGIQRGGKIEEFSTEDWMLTFNVNIRSQFLSVKYALPYLKKSPNASIVNMASAGAIKGGPGLTAYTASKGAVISFTKTLASELGPYRIRANSVSPGWIDTPFNKSAIEMMGGSNRLDALVQQSVPLKRQGKPEEVATAIAYLASDEASFINGQSIVIDGGMI